MAAINFKLSNKGGDAPQIVVTLRAGTAPQVRLQTRTDLFAYRPLWSETKQRHNKNNAGARLAELTETDASLDTLASGLDVAYIRAVGAGEAIDKEWLAAQVERILHPEREQERLAAIAAANRPPRLLEAVRQFLTKIDEGRAVIHTGKSKGKTIGADRRRIYSQTEMHLANFLKSIGRDDIELEELNREFFDDFTIYLQRVPLAKNTIWSRFRDLKAVVRDLAERWPEIEDTCPLLRYSKKFNAPKEEVDNIALTFADLDRLAALDLQEHPALDRTRDQFLLLAWTGQRYSDLDKLTADHITERDGARYFDLRQKKTDEPVLVRIFDDIVPILEKYDYQPPAPISNQKFNKNLKAVCELAGLTEPVTRHQSRMNATTGKVERMGKRMRRCDAVGSHTGRRTFATNMYNIGMPLMEIMAITGHTSIDTLLNYIKVGRQDLAVKAGETYEAWRRNNK